MALAPIAPLLPALISPSWEPESPALQMSPAAATQISSEPLSAIVKTVAVPVPVPSAKPS
jgi:hypothetical protein